MANEIKKDVVFRRKNSSFSMIANPIIDDKNISPAAGWLFVIIQRWITFSADDFVCSKAFIASKFPSGYRMFNRAWDELKDFGYLKMYSHPIDGWQADLLDEPRPDEPHTYYLDKSGEIKSTNIDRAEKKAAKNAKLAEEDHYPQNGTNGTHYPQNDSNGNDINGNGGNIINTIYKNFDNMVNNNQSIYQYDVIEGPPISLEKQTDRLIDGNLVEKIKNQIEYDVLLQDFEKELIDIAVSCISDLYTASGPQTFNDRTFAAEYVYQRACEIKEEHISYVFECFIEQKEKVYNVRKYLLTAIFNAPDTIGAYYENAVRAAGLITG